MWYVGWNDAQEIYGIGYAESTDGTSWAKYPGNPVLIPGNPGAWDNFEAQSPSVIKDGAVYRMWYYGIQSEGIPDRIGYAFSRDGIYWEKYAGNPVMMNGPSGSFDDQGAWSPVVVKAGNSYRMWYIGTTNCTGDGCLDQVGYATASAYDGPTPVLNDVAVVALNRSPANGGPQLMFNVIPQGPSPIDMNAF
jgi:hypothetical protein